MTRAIAPGLALVAALTAAAFAVARPFATLSPLIAGVVIGALVANLAALSGIGLPAATAPGVTFAAKKLLRVGIVILGLRLALSDLADLGLNGALVVAMVVTATFFGTQALARWLGVAPNLGLLVATGYSICGASAIAAMDGLIDADEEETAYAVALVTLCGSLSIIVLPAIGNLLGLADPTFGAWSGAAVHDVAQVIATAATHGDDAVESATVVKLTRVALLAPIVTAVAIGRRRSAGPTSTDGKRPPLIPAFVVGFLAAVALRSTGWLSADQLAFAKHVEKILLALALVGLGLGVNLSQLRRLGGRPLLLGLSAWVLVASVAYGGVQLVNL